MREGRYERTPRREDLEEAEIRAMLEELGWEEVQIRDELGEARRRGFPFAEWVAAHLYYYRAERREGGPEYAVAVERNIELDPCSLLFAILHDAGSDGSTIIEVLRYRFKTDHEACRWLMTAHERLDGRTPRELIHAGKFREVLELFPR